MKRERQIGRVGLIGICVNVLLAAFKAVIGAISGSIAIVLDAVNNLSDVLSGLITIIGTKLASKPADKDHPYGHGRYEYIAALIIAFTILAAGLAALYKAIGKIIHPSAVNYDVIAFIIMGVAVVTKILLGHYTKKAGVRLNSGSLVASGIDALFDAVVTSATLISALIFVVFGLNLDGWIGAAISLLIIKIGIELINGTISDLLGRRPDPALSRSIKEDIISFPEVSGVYDLSLNIYGPSRMIGAVNIEISEKLSAREIHELSLRIRKKIMAGYGIYLYVGIYAERLDEANLKLKEGILKLFKEKYPQILEIHAFFLDEKNGKVQFDAVLDFSVKDRSAFHQKILAALKKAWPQYDFSVNIDIDLSD